MARTSRDSTNQEQLSENGSIQRHRHANRMIFNRKSDAFARLLSLCSLFPSAGGPNQIRCMVVGSIWSAGVIYPRTKINMYNFVVAEHVSPSFVAKSA